MNVISVSMGIIIFLVICFIWSGLWFRKLVTSSDDFLLAGRGAPFWLMASAYLGGYVGGASVSGYVNLGFNVGISGMWTSLFVLSGSIAFCIIFSRRVNYFGRKTGAVTISDFVCERYGEKLRLPIALCSIMRPTFLTGMQFLAIAVVTQIVFGLELKIGIVVSALIILLYLITAGQYSALVTQWFQSVLQAVGILVFAVAAYKMIGNPTLVTDTMFSVLPAEKMDFWSVNFSLFSVWFLTFGLFYLVDPWIFMWGYIGKTPRVSSNAMLAVLSGSYYNVLPFLAGMALLLGSMQGIFTIPEGLSRDGLYAWFTINHVSPILGVLILVGLLMTIISCGSSFAMNGVTIFTRDIYQKLINPNANQQQMLFASRISLVLVVLIGIASALWLPILVPLWSLAQAIGISGLLATTLCAWFWRRSTTAGAWASTVGGGVVAFAWACLAWVQVGSPGGLVPVAGIPLHAVHVGLAVSIPLMYIVSLMTKPEPEKADATNYRVLGEEMQTSNLVEDRQTSPGLFGWLGADTTGWKVFWLITGVIVAVHYLFSFVFHIPFFGLAMVWTSFVVGFLMIFILCIMGGIDLKNMIQATKEIK